MRGGNAISRAPCWCCRAVPPAPRNARAPAQVRNLLVLHNVRLAQRLDRHRGACRAVPRHAHAPKAPRPQHAPNLIVLQPARLQPQRLQLVYERGLGRRRRPPARRVPAAAATVGRRCCREPRLHATGCSSRPCSLLLARRPRSARPPRIAPPPRLTSLPLRLMSRLNFFIVPPPPTSSDQRAAGATKRARSARGRRGAAASPARDTPPPTTLKLGDVQGVGGGVNCAGESLASVLVSAPAPCTPPLARLAPLPLLLATTRYQLCESCALGGAWTLRTWQPMGMPAPAHPGSARRWWRWQQQQREGDRTTG